MHTQLMRAISEASGRSAESLKNDMKETGDVGLVGELAKGRQKTIWTRAASSLTCGALHKTLLTVTTLKGNEVRGTDPSQCT
jgi:ATP-dependent DNA ligase